MIRKYARGQVWWVRDNTNYKNGVIGKTRPYVIVSNDHNNLVSKSLTMCAITTKNSSEEMGILGTYPIPNDSHYSSILVNQIKTISKDDLGSYIGVLDNKCMKDISEMIKELLCLTPESLEEFSSVYEGKHIYVPKNEDNTSSMAVIDILSSEEVSDEELANVDDIMATIEVQPESVKVAEPEKPNIVKKALNVVPKSPIKLKPAVKEKESVIKKPEVQTKVEDNVPRFKLVPNNKDIFTGITKIRSINGPVAWSLRLHKLAKVDIDKLSTKQLCNRYEVSKSNISKFRRKVKKENISMVEPQKIAK